MMQTHDRAITAAEHSTVDTLSQSLLVYRSAAAEFAKANPAFTGNPADAALSLPAWFKKPAGISTYITAGRSYTFYSGGPPGLPAALSDATESELVGVKRSGVLVSPRSMSTAIALPASIPEGAVVALN
nr:type IV pilus biogenesis protein PilM [Pseudomonas benzenivorans]